VTVALFSDLLWWHTGWVALLAACWSTAGYLWYRREALLNHRLSAPRRAAMTLSTVLDIEREYMLRDDFDTFEKRAAVRSPLDRHFFHARYEQVQRLLDEHAGGARSVLDVGCGFGIHTLHIGRTFPGTAIGLELNLLKLIAARRTVEPIAAGTRIHFVCADASCPPFRPGSFDCILLTEVLEHLIDPAAGLTACNEMLAPGGTIVITTPGRHNLDYHTNPLFILEKVLSLAWDAILPPYHHLHAQFEFNWRKPEARYGMHHHFSWQELARLVERAGFTTVWRGGFEIECFGHLVTELLARGEAERIRQRVAPWESLLARTPVIRWLGQHLLLVARKGAHP
jgi:SAM-dependent methyltransferase